MQKLLWNYYFPCTCAIILLLKLNVAFIFFNKLIKSFALCLFYVHYPDLSYTACSAAILNWAYTHHTSRYFPYERRREWGEGNHLKLSSFRHPVFGFQSKFLILYENFLHFYLLCLCTIVSIHYFSLRHLLEVLFHN